MKKLKKYLTPAVTIPMLVLSIVLMAFGSVGVARAAMTYFSDTYSSRVQLSQIGVTLVENGSPISKRNYNASGDGRWDETVGVLFGGLREELNKAGEDIKLGVQYPEVLSVRNSGNIGQYVRVSIYKYWYDEDHERIRDLSPQLLDLHFDPATYGSSWVLDKNASSSERTVLYYNQPLAPGAETVPFTDYFSINSSLGTKVREEVDGNAITTVYEYDGVSFEVRAVVDAVQEHNAEDAMKSAWGVDFGGSLG